MWNSWFYLHMESFCSHHIHTLACWQISVSPLCCRLWVWILFSSSSSTFSPFCVFSSRFSVPIFSFWYCPSTSCVTRSFISSNLWCLSSLTCSSFRVFMTTTIVTDTAIVRGSNSCAFMLPRRGASSFGPRWWMKSSYRCRSEASRAPTWGSGSPKSSALTRSCLPPGHTSVEFTEYRSISWPTCSPGWTLAGVCWFCAAQLCTGRSVETRPLPGSFRIRWPSWHLLHSCSSLTFIKSFLEK